MSNPIAQVTEWTHALHKQVSDQLFDLTKQISSWLLLGNVGALVLLFNSKLGKDFLPADQAQEMAFAFSVGLFCAFGGYITSILSATLGLQRMTRGISALHDILIAQHFIDELERDGIDVPDDAPLNQTITTAGEQFPRIQKQLKTVWLSVGVCVLFYLGAAVSFARGCLIAVY